MCEYGYGYREYANIFPIDCKMMTNMDTIDCA